MASLSGGPKRTADGEAAPHSAAYQATHPAAHSTGNPSAGEAPPRKRPIRLAILLALGAVLVLGSAVWAHAALFGSFSDYDDEGYLLLALRAWREGNGLYDRIPTLYGPFYFQCVSAIFAVLRLPLDNAGARWFALGVWIVASLLCGGYAWRVHRSVLAAAAAWALAFGALGALVNEPLHPGSLIVLLLAISAHISLGLRVESPRLGTWALLGALAAAVALSKLNVGAFLVLAVLGTWLRFGEGRGALQAARVLFALMLVGVPLALMRGLLGERWVQDYAILTSVPLLPFGLMLLRAQGDRPWPIRGLSAFAAGGIALTLGSIAIAIATGSTLGGIWQQLIVASTKFTTQTWLQPMLPPRWVILTALLVVPLAFVLRSRTSPAGRIAFAALRFAAAAHALTRCTTFDTSMAALPFLWILALPGAGEERAPARARANPSGERPLFFLALMACLQSLHAFPVAGSQIGFFVFLIPMLAVAGIASAWRDLPADWRERVPGWLAKPTQEIAVAGSVLVIAGFHPAWRALSERWRSYRDEEVELSLPGTGSMRLLEWRAAAYAWIAANVRRNGETLLGMPGKQSVHLWSGVPSPVPFYPGAWPLLYGEEEQRQLADALLAHASPCIVLTPDAIETWRRERGLVDRAIARMVDERFQVAGEAFGIEILVLKDTKPDVVMTATSVEIPAGIPFAAKDWMGLRLAFPEIEGASLARCALVHLETGSVACDTAARAEAERMRLVDDNSHLLGDAGASSPRIDLSARRDVIVLCPPSIRKFGGGTFLVRCHDASGRVVARLPLLR